MPKSDKKRQRSSKLIPKSNLSRGGLLAFVLIFAAVGGYLLWHSFAAPAAPSIYLTPSPSVVGPSSTMTIQVRENSGTTGVNAVQANFSYPSSLFTCTASTASYNPSTKTAGDISLAGGAFTTVAQISCGAGQASIGLGTPAGGGAVSGDQLVATITFHSAASGGSGSMAFTSGTKLVSSSTNQDILGSLANTAGGTYTVDTTPPAVSITSPANNAVLAGGTTISVNASASDGQSAVVKVQFYIDGTLVATDTASPYSYSWNTTGVSLAAHSLVAKAYDTFNNLATSSTVNVTLADQTAPSTPGSFKASSSTTSSVTLTWTASTDNVGVTAYKLKRGGTLIATITPPTLTYTDSGLNPNTTYSYSLQATDAAGNLSPAATLNAATPAQTPGDINDDGTVDAVDLSILLGDFNTTAAESDLNHDGIVDVLDLSILLSAYGT